MSIAKMFEAGRMAAREDQERSALAKHLQPALGGDKAAQQAIYGVAPMRGMEVESLAQQRQQGASEAARKQLADLSTLAARAPQMAAQVYPQWRAALEATGIATGLPEQYEEGAMEAMRAFAQGGGDEQYTLAPGSARYGGDGRLIVERPFAPPKPDFQLYDGADGPVWLPKPGAGPMPAATAAPPSGGVLDPVRDFGDLSGIPGVKTTSLFRDPERNARVGGVPGSFHTKGQAGDFVVPQDQKAQFIQRARDMGYDAIDEGDHVHVEPRRGATAASAFGPGQGVTAIPVQGVRPKPKAGAVAFAPLTQDEIQQVGLPAGTVAQRNLQTGEIKIVSRPTAPPRSAQADAKRAREVQQQEASFGEIERLTNRLDSMNNVSGWSSTLMPFGEDRNTYESTAGQLAVLLKPLIRGPGEGTWTDKDQELLERLVPKLDNYEGTNKEVISNIRSLIKSRRKGLGGGQQPAAPPPAAGGFRILPD